jgi:hypothetical protein
MRRNRTGSATAPASGEGPAGTVVTARAPQEREPAAERAATGGGRGVGLLVGGQAASTIGDACYAVALPWYVLTGNLASGGVFSIALPVLAHQRFGTSGYGLVLAALAAGAVAGTTLGAWIRSRRPAVTAGRMFLAQTAALVLFSHRRARRRPHRGGHPFRPLPDRIPQLRRRTQGLNRAPGSAARTGSRPDHPGSRSALNAATRPRQEQRELELDVLCTAHAARGSMPSSRYQPGT